jgi:hypothetical protein
MPFFLTCLYYLVPKINLICVQEPRVTDIAAYEYPECIVWYS